MNTTMSGRHIRHVDFPSDEVVPRHVDVWTPPNYDESAERYPVIYMHDGQNLFHGDLSYSGVPWGVDHAAARLAVEGQIRVPIIVGIWNSEHRMQEYMPQKPVEIAPVLVGERFSKRHNGHPCSDDYLRFIVDELKPFIDNTYRTLPEREDTFVMGSSMGGIISLYAFCEYPDVFSGAACLSTSWTIAGGAFIPYLRKAVPPAKSHRIYFDYGSEARIATYESYQKQADRLFKKAGYRKNKNWTSRRFPGADHSERAWQDRIDEPLLFLLRKTIP